MSKIFRALSALLSYPDETLQRAASELRAAVDGEDLLPLENRRALNALIEEIATGDLFAMQERYVELFDRTRSLSLHLFEHVYGESRDRGRTHFLGIACLDEPSQELRERLLLAA